MAKAESAGRQTLEGIVYELEGTSLEIRKALGCFEEEEPERDRIGDSLSDILHSRIDRIAMVVIELDCYLKTIKNLRDEL